MKTLTASIVIFAVSMGLTSGTYAHQQSDDKGEAMLPAQHATPTTSFSEAELQKFVAAQKEIDTIKKDYTARLKNTADPDKALELQQEASVLMMNAVKNKGLEVETYNNIVLAMGNNPDLRKKLKTMQ